MSRPAPAIGALIAACALAAALVLPAAAAGAVHSLKGKVKGDANGTVTLKVVVKRGAPIRVRSISYSKLDGFCDQDESVGYETPAGERSGALKGSARVEYGGAFMAIRYGPNPQRTGVFGKVRQKGKKVKATIEVYFDLYCKAGGTFVAT